MGWGDGIPLLKDEAVVPVDIWVLANDALKNRPKRGPVAKTNRPMLAKLKCLRCGAPMYRKKIGGRLSRRYVYRCEGQGPQRKGCGNLVPYDRLENMVAVRMLAWHDEPYQIRTWIEGKNWDAEMADTLQSLQRLNPMELGLDEYNRRHAELMAQLAAYQRKNEREATPGGWDYVDVHNDDGSVKTKGQHFYDLYTPYVEGGSVDPAREYLKTHDIHAERMACCDGIRVTINGREDVAHKLGCPMAARQP
jgi:hypothetical protein